MILKTMDGTITPLGKEEAMKVAKAMQQGAGHILFRGSLIPKAGIAIYTDEMWETRDGNKNPMGRLHDGTVVERRFGKWVDYREPSAVMNLEYYPEIARDEVLTESEWQRNKLDAGNEADRIRYYEVVKARISDTQDSPELLLT